MPAMHETNLDGRVAIVTGSGQNIGAAIARRLAEAGAAVVVNGHTSRENVERTVSEIREAGGRAVGIMADVSDPKDVGRLVAEANAAFGPVDIAVSNVGRRLLGEIRAETASFRSTTVSAVREDWMVGAPGIEPGTR